MRFSYTDDQLAFRDAVRDLLADQCTPAIIRTAWDGMPDPRPWDALVEMGVTSVLVAEADGGLGLDEVFLAPILEECGYAGLPQPIVETAMIAAPLGVEGMATTDLGGPLVPAVDVADVFLLTDGADRLRVLPSDGVGFELRESVDRARHLGEVRAAAPDLEISVIDDPDVVALARTRGVLGTAAMQLGLARRMLDMTVEYVAERQQFGKPIGSQQALKHHLANVRLAIEFAGPTIARAALAVAEREPDRDRQVSMAKYFATSASDTAGRACLQCHGAIGYTVEHDLQLFMKRAWALARSWGDATHHVDAVAATLWPA